MDSAGNAYVSGVFSGTATFGSASLPSAGDTDIFLTKLGGLASQTITFFAIGNRTFGDSSFAVVSARASSGLPLSFTASGNCTIDINTEHSATRGAVTITGAGSCIITASQAGDGNYFPAVSVQQSFTIAKGTPVITWNSPGSIVAGTPLSGTQLNATVTLNGNSVSGTFNYNPPGGTVLAIGNGQTLALNFTPFDAANLNSPAQKTVTINVTAPPQTITTSATNVLQGNVITVTWANIANPTAKDWIGLYAAGASNTAYLSWFYLSCSQTPGLAPGSGSCPLVIPASLPNGNYQVRYLVNDGFSGIASSAAIDVGSSSSLP